MSGFVSIASVVRRLSDLTCRATELILCIIGSGMALLLGVQVFSRYVFNYSLFWSEEIGRMCLVWITFLGASAVYKRHGHIGIDFFVRFLPEGLRRASELLVVLASLAFFWVLLYYGFEFAGFVLGQKTAALGLPMAAPYMVIPLSACLFLLHGLSHLLQLLYPAKE